MEKEIWKDIVYPELETYYEISNFGQVRTKDREIVDKNGTVYHKKASFCKIGEDRYRRSRFAIKKINGGSTNKSLDFMVATMFVPNPNNYTSIDHIDNDLTNNKASNLRWVDAESDPKFKTVIDLEKEIWKPFPENTIYEISNLGRVKVLPRNIKTNVDSDYTIPKPEMLLTPVVEERSGYCAVGLQIKNKTKTIRVHRLVAQLFIPNPDNKTDVDHINHDKTDNRAENLRWVTKEENNRNGGTTAIDVTYPDGHVERFNSIIEAAEQTGVKYNTIRANCSRKSAPKNGWKFRFANQQSHLGQKNRRKGNAFELKVIHDLNNIGFNVVSSRSESKNKDNQKIDVFDVDNTLPTNIQIKYCNTTPNYFSIRDACGDKSLPFSIVWKKSTNDGKNSPGIIAMIPYNFFLELLENQKIN